jgi:hypothetical protein
MAAMRLTWTGKFSNVVARAFGVLVRMDRIIYFCF